MRLAIPCLLFFCGVAGFTADEPVTYEPGCLAKIYVIGMSNDYNDKRFWPIQAVPDTPSEVIRLREGPNIEGGRDPENNSLPNRLITSKIGILNEVNFYVVEYEGWLGCKNEGIYTLSAQTDDPIEIFVEGRSVIKTDHAAEINNASERDISISQASIKLGGSRYYHVSILAKQRWYKIKFNGDQPHYNAGAHLKVWLASPSGKPAIIPLCLPSKFASP